MRITYDASVDAAYIYFVEIETGGVSTTVPGDPASEAFGVNLDFDRNGRLLGVDIEGASSRLPTAFLERFANRSVDAS
ncbi:MAG TPA: DUF2283 domain-containing protein [Gaiellaceae bacterium]